MDWLKLLIFCFIFMPAITLTIMTIYQIIVKSGAIWLSIESTWRFLRRFSANHHREPDVECGRSDCTHAPMQPALPQALIIVNPHGPNFDSEQAVYLSTEHSAPAVRSRRTPRRPPCRPAPESSLGFVHPALRIAVGHAQPFGLP